MMMFQTLARSVEPHEALEVSCACGRRASWSRAQAMRLFGPDATPTDVRRRLVCGGCGRRDGVRLRVV